MTTTTTNTDDVIKQDTGTTTPTPTASTANLANDIKTLRHETRKLIESLRLRQNRLLRQYQRQPPPSSQPQTQQQQQQTGTQTRLGGRILGRTRRRLLFGR
ncbi:MAG: hypothetical protein QXQ68_06045 [Candidatus Nitrosocaldaceae archaeon]